MKSKCKIDWNQILSVTVGGLIVIISNYLSQNRDFEYKDKNFLIREFPRYSSKISYSFYDFKEKILIFAIKNYNKEINDEFFDTLRKSYINLKSNVESLEFITAGFGIPPLGNDLYGNMEILITDILKSYSNKSDVDILSVNNNIEKISSYISKISQNTKKNILEKIRD